MSAETPLASGAAPRRRSWTFADWVELHVRPAGFFAGAARRLDVAPAVLVVGMAAVIDRFDTQAVMGDLRGRPAPALEEWWQYWIAVVVGACLAGPIAWVVQGWWIRTRARFCGDAHANADLCRRIAVFTMVIAALPTIANSLLATAVIESPAASEEPLPGLAILMLGSIGWSVFASFRAVTGNFQVSRRAALIWFAILPALFYSAFLVGTGIAYLRTFS